MSSRFSIATGGRIAIGDAVQAADARLHIKETTTTDVLLLETTEDSSTASPVFKMKRNSSSPADADYLGQIKFAGENDADQEVNYAKITGKIGDASSGTEDGIIEIAHRKAGSNNISARFTSTDLKLINGTGLEVAGSITSSGNLTISNTHPQIFFTDTDNNSDFKIQNLNGVFGVRDETNSATRLSIASNGTVDVAVDGKEVAANINALGTAMESLGSITSTSLGASFKGWVGSFFTDDGRIILSKFACKEFLIPKILFLHRIRLSNFSLIILCSSA